MDLVEGPLLASALTGLLCLTAYVITSTLCARLPTLTRWGAGVAALAGICTAIFHLLAWERAFNRWTVLACTTAFAAITWSRFGGWQQVSAHVRRDCRFARKVGRR